MRQVEGSAILLLCMLQHDVIFCAEHLDHLEESFKAKMETLKDTVQSKTAVPTAQVYVC